MGGHWPRPGQSAHSTPLGYCDWLRGMCSKPDQWEATPGWLRGNSGPQKLFLEGIGRWEYEMQSGTAGGHFTMMEWASAEDSRADWWWWAPGYSQAWIHPQTPTYKSQQMPFLESVSYRMQERLPVTCSWKHDGDGKECKYPEQRPQPLAGDSSAGICGELHTQPRVKGDTEAQGALVSKSQVASIRV